MSLRFLGWFFFTQYNLDKTNTAGKTDWLTMFEEVTIQWNAYYIYHLYVSLKF